MCRAGFWGKKVPPANDGSILPAAYVPHAGESRRQLKERGGLWPPASEVTPQLLRDAITLGVLCVLLVEPGEGGCGCKTLLGRVQDDADVLVTSRTRKTNLRY